jgi:hypothetical protein
MGVMAGIIDIALLRHLAIEFHQRLGAVGDLGASVGYSPIAPSVAVALRTYIYNVIEIDQGGGLGGPSQSLNLQDAQCDVSDTGTINISYDGIGTLTLTGRDSGGDVINLSAPVDLSTLGGSVYIGFTGASASGSADEEITGFMLNGLSSTPEPAAGLLLIPALGVAAFLCKRVRRG